MEHIHNKAIFDSLNEALNQYRPYYLAEGTPFAWSVSEKNIVKYEITKHNMESIYNQAKKQVLMFQSYLCGLVNKKERPKALSASE